MGVLEYNIECHAVIGTSAEQEGRINKEVESNKGSANKLLENINGSNAERVNY